MKTLLLAGVLSSSLLFAKDFSENITERQAHCIDFIFSSLAEKGKMGLVMNSISLISKGNEIEPVPPLEFLSHMMKKPEIFKYMERLQKKDKHFQWNQFISGFKKKCNSKKEYQSIKDNIELFAEDVDFPVCELQTFVDNKDWSGLIGHLLTRREE